jgi:hypothetical protein
VAIALQVKTSRLSSVLLKQQRVEAEQDLLCFLWNLQEEVRWWSRALQSRSAARRDWRELARTGLYSPENCAVTSHILRGNRAPGKREKVMPRDMSMTLSMRPILG